MIAYEDDGLFEEPVTCAWCGKTHELQQSFFCRRCSQAQGVCPSCWAEHNEDHP